MKFVLVVLSCLLAGAFATKPPKWPDVYSVSGMLTIPYAEINEPFYAWYDKTNGRSRVDYYGGMVKTYQLTKQGDYGVSLKLAPVTTQNQMNKETCLCKQRRFISLAGSLGSYMLIHIRFRRG